MLRFGNPDEEILLDHLHNPEAFRWPDNPNYSKPMLCYRDMTFCAGNGCTNFPSCPRAITEAVEAGAEMHGLRIAQFCEPEKLRCYRAPEPANETP